MKLKLIDRRSLPAADLGCWLDRSTIPGELAAVVAGLGRGSWTVNIVLGGDDLVADLNQRYRGREGVTDVLSFSYLEEAGTGEPDLAAGQGRAAVDLWRDLSQDMVGEVVLAPGFVAQRCRAEGWGLETEFALLVIHGCLHVLGWDHVHDDQQQAMRKLETELLAGMGLLHPLAG